MRLVPTSDGQLRSHVSPLDAILLSRLLPIPFQKKMVLAKTSVTSDNPPKWFGLDKASLTQVWSGLEVW